MSDAKTPGPWVWCEWTILDEDRPAQAAGKPYWTAIAGSGALTQGPLGRKAMCPETIINAEGYETEGISVRNDADASLIAAAPDLLEALFSIALCTDDPPIRNIAKEAIAKVKGK